MIGHVYVNDNTVGVNTIAGFDRHANGTLTPEAGSPFRAGGAGLASQGSIQIAPGGRFLHASDAGSNQISVLWIRQEPPCRQRLVTVWQTLRRPGPHGDRAT